MRLLAPGMAKTVSALSMLLLTLFAVFVFAGAFLRYGFDFGSAKLDDFVAFSFSALIVFSIFHAFAKDAHVRVNAFNGLKSRFKHPFVRLIAAMPFFMIAFLSVRPVFFSWSIMEASPEQGGLPGLFIIKTLLPVSFFMAGLFVCLVRDDGDQ